MSIVYVRQPTIFDPHPTRPDCWNVTYPCIFMEVPNTNIYEYAAIIERNFSQSDQSTFKNKINPILDEQAPFLGFTPVTKVIFFA